DTLYQTGQWKIFSVFITPGSDKKEPFFDFTRARFDNDLDYLNFIYQLRSRSMFNLDTVDINENDQIVTLCTCTYEINDYRLVICARKVREGEDPTVNTDSIKKNSHPLYPELYYEIYGGKAPKLPVTFEEAMGKGKINWYKPVDK
ncbi:MAG TPA: class B sortase, partial [Mobilitalea sp.]|nr:class B sortase [Mobilitalea sp.]